MGDNSSQVCLWVESALQNHGLSNYQIEVEGRTNKGEGYGSEIHFIKVTGFTKDGEEKILRLAVKSSFADKNVREQVSSITDAFLKEISIYGVVKTSFERFLIEKKCNEKIDFMPYCYSTHNDDDNQFLVFGNLRKQNFELWDKSLPMTHKHTQLILEAYGKWHALSMAVKNQRPDVFKNLIKGEKNMFGYLMKEMKFDVIFWEEFKKGRELAIKEDEHNLIKNLQYSPDDLNDAFTNLFSEDAKYQVILHGDCWTNNYLFKSNGDKTNPTEVRILDWQCSGVASPVFDLSHFIYSCVDTEKYEDEYALLKIYYNSFSRCLISLGSNPEEIFSFQKLVEHWKKFSHYGLFISCFVIRVCLLGTDDFPDFTETVKSGKHVSENFNISVPYDDRFIKRVRSNFLHYCKIREQ